VLWLQSLSWQYSPRFSACGEGQEAQFTGPHSGLFCPFYLPNYRFKALVAAPEFLAKAPEKVPIIAVIGTFGAA
jgi:hypothetical protein